MKTVHPLVYGWTVWKLKSLSSVDGIQNKETPTWSASVCQGNFHFRDYLILVLAGWINIYFQCACQYWHTDFTWLWDIHLKAHVQSLLIWYTVWDIIEVSYLLKYFLLISKDSLTSTQWECYTLTKHKCLWHTRASGLSFVLTKLEKL